MLQRYIQRLNQQLQQRAQSTSTSANKAVNQAAKPEQAGRAAGEAVQNAATSSSATATATKELPPSFLPTTENWTKIVGTVGALANWTIPMAAIAHMTTKPADTIDPKMSATLGIYSCFFMRWALAISPANYPLLVCHVINATLQTTQLVRYFTAAKTSSQTASSPSQPATTAASQKQLPSTDVELVKVVPGDKN